MTRQRPERLLTALFILAIPVAPLCPQSPPGLVAIQRFGWDTPDGPKGTTPAQRRLDGGMLSNVVDLAEGANGDLYVLDRDAFKVVVFDKNGTVRRVIGNGKGAGPGEFIRAVSVAVSDSELFVLDGGQARISVFDTAGALRRTFSVATSLGNQIRATHDRLYLSQYVLKGGAPLISVYDHGGTLLDKVFVPTEEDASFGRTGNAYRMAVMRNGQVGVGRLNPGIWSMVDAPSRLLGRRLVPDNTVQSSGTAWVTPAALRGFGEMADGRGLVLYDHFKPGAMDPAHPVVNIFLALVAADGSSNVSIDVGGVGRNLLVDRDGKSFYLTVAEPSYQVVRFRFIAN